MDPILRKRLRDDSISGLSALGADMSESEYPSGALRHALDHQLQAIRLGAVYGALAFAGLIATHLVLGGPQAGLGALLAIAAAAVAYLNFSIVAADRQSRWINPTQVLSVLLGVLSGSLILAGALS